MQALCHPRSRPALAARHTLIRRPGHDRGQHQEDQDQSVTKLSPRSVPDTVTRFTGILDDLGLKLFAVIDQSAEAAAAGLTLREIRTGDLR